MVNRGKELGIRCVVLKYVYRFRLKTEGIS